MQIFDKSNPKNAVKSFSSAFTLAPHASAGFCGLLNLRNSLLRNIFLGKDFPMLKGLLLKESLNNLSILNTLQITKTETWNVQNAAASQPNIWIAISFEVDKNQADDLAETLSQSIKQAGWFINALTDSLVYVIFPSKVFKYDKGDKEQRLMAIEHGRSLGIPESQLDWNE